MGHWRLNSAGRTALYLAKFAAGVTLLARGESLAASMSDYFITQLKGDPKRRSPAPHPELPTATAKPAWKPWRSSTSGPASVNRSPPRLPSMTCPSRSRPAR